MSIEEMGQLTREDEVQALAAVLRPFKKDHTEVLALNDARMILSVYGQRKKLKEDHKANPYGYATWWLTQETQIRRATGDLVRKKGSLYMIRPDFILNFIALSPTTEDVRNTYKSVFPTLLGIRLSNRMREDIFHDVMEKTRDVIRVDDARAKVMMQDYSNQLKGDFFKQYETKWDRERHEQRVE